MFSKGIPNEYKTRINDVINFIVLNLTEDLSLQQLAKVADYSPFHFQKIFKQVVGESPKQYVIRLRLETSAHALVIHRHKTVTEIALNNGFSSSATFARAFKSYFGVSAEEFRSAPFDDSAKRYQNRQISSENSLSLREIELCIESLNIQVTMFPSFRGVFINAKLNDNESIQNAFFKIIQLAETHDLLTANSRFIGVIYLHSNIYRAMVTIEDEKIQIPKRLNVLEFSSGKFATIDLDKSFQESMEKLQIFVKFWIPKSGYQIADIVGYEFLLENPTKKPFNEIKKKIYIPIEPIR